MNFNEIIRKNVTYDDIKKDTKTNLCTLFEGSLLFEIYSQVKAREFFEWNFNISFYQISNLSFYLSKNNCVYIITYTKTSAHVCDYVQQFYGNCQSLTIHPPAFSLSHWYFEKLLLPIYGPLTNNFCFTTYILSIK